jgi:dihydrofolate reductase
MIITQVPLLLGEGIPLFGKINNRVKLESASSKAFPNDFVQTKYSIKYV